ncbi:undecaprenyl-diphosphatase BcrC [Clostridium ragsdalei P11]|uniref:Undecaprenyl-diphosphatase BcrC n=1 Tax=Clostridium ragsdalei P11 TaxID=1353534 RepID=A0A1A6AS71_9CLOT|nr:phosphatase PAP2 family protein [Clostridium ragsdalei]OBR92926.1 undecaprenyl-diphosphatase BcrC [Clostridium ragsdalei P11]
MNMELFRLINNLANKNLILDKIMIFFSKYSPFIFVAVLSAVFILGIVKRNSKYRKGAVNALFITSLNLILNCIIGGIYYVDRPFVHNKVNLLLPHTSNASFPSDHAAGTMSIALGFKNYNKSLSLILTFLSLIVGFSRVYVGNHYPMDVIAAYVIVWITNYIYNLILRRKIQSLYEVIENKFIAHFAV